MAPLHRASGSEVPKLAAGMRYLKEELSAGGAKVLPSQACLEDFVLDAIEAARWAKEGSESYIASLRRHLRARARFILRWMGSDEALEGAAWRALVGVALKHALPRAPSSADKSPKRR